MNETLKVYASPLPFSNRQMLVKALPGSTLRQIVENVVPEKYKGAGVAAVVMINGEIIPMAYWDSVRPKIHTLVNVRVVPQGGGGGGKKNPLATILSIAVMIAAPYVAGAILGPTLAATQIGIGTLTYGGLLSSAIGVVGRLAISALAPPPKSSATTYGGGGASNPAESRTQFIEGARNSLSPFGVVPVNLGTNRMFPLQAARPFTESQNNEQYVRQLFTYGYGPQVIISDLKIGESSITDFTNFDVEHRLNGDLHEGTSLFSNDVYQEDLQVLLLESAGFTTRTTQADIDEAIIDITFPRGLVLYNSEGNRQSTRVQLEVQYAEHGVSPQVWSPAATSYSSISGVTVTIDPVVTSSGTVNVFRRIDSIIIDQYSGNISVVTGTSSTEPPPLGSHDIRIASVEVVTTRNPSNGALSTDITVVDVRQSSLFGTTFQNSSSFVPTKASTTTVDVSSGGLSVNELDITGNQREALRRSTHIKFPANGQYDIRIRRIFPEDNSSEQRFDEVYLSAIKSIKYKNPVNLVGINGTAVRIKATDQLNGALDQFNVIISTCIPDYDLAAGTWITRITSNPASIYRYVLQGLPNGKRLSDSKININDLEAWHTHCAAKGYEYNRVIDYEASVDEVLRDVASAGAASPAIVDGKRTVVVDQVKDDIVQIITPRNSWGYQGEMIYPELPHAFRVQFRNKENGYAQDEIIVYDDGYNETNATEYETLEWQSCTNYALAFKHGRRNIAGARLRPENHSWVMDVENLVALRGNRVKLEHDAPIVGVGDGRIKTVVTDGNSPAMVTGFTIDDTVTIPSTGTYYVRIRLADGTQLYKEISTSVGSFSTFNFAVPFDVDDTPAAGDLCYFVEAGGELDLIITRIEPQDDLTARMSGLNYAQPEIDNAESSPIPAFNSQITTPLEFIRPLPPVLLDEQSNESVMLVNSDGSFTPRAVFTLQNRNSGTISTEVKVRISGTSAFTNADVLESTPERLVITGLEDGKRYDIHIRYRRANSTMMSLPLELNNYLFLGSSGNPDDVTGFKINVAGDTAYFKWDANDDIDLSHYIMKYSGVYSGASWATAQTLESHIYENRISFPLLGGTYLIKAVDRGGNESDTAAVIITYDPGAIANAVAIVDEFNDSPSLSGVLDNVTVTDSALTLADTDLIDGYYYFAGMVDLTDVFPAFVSATVVANGAFVNNIFDITDVFDTSDVFGAGDNDVFDMSDVFALDDFFGIGFDAWAVELQYATTNTDPNNSPPDWSSWQPLEAGVIEFRAIKFRLKMTSLAQDVSPQVTQLSVKIDMPDRIERGEDSTVPAAGATVTFDPEFKATPAIAITIQDGAVDDRIEFITKTAGGFTFKVYNDTAGTYVDRNYDFIASGYGRKNT